MLSTWVYGRVICKPSSVWSRVHIDENKTAQLKLNLLNIQFKAYFHLYARGLKSGAHLHIHIRIRI